MDLQFLFASHSYKQSDFSSNIVMLLIDNYSEKQMRQTIESLLWRKSDPVILEKLTQAGARLIGYDLEFTGESTPYDEKLSEAFFQAPHVIACEKEMGSTIPMLRKNIDSLTDPSAMSFYRLPRRIMKEPPESGLISFSYEMASLLKTDLPSPEIWINFRYPANYFPRISYSDLYFSDQFRLKDFKKTPLSIFKNKIIIIAKEFDKDSIALPNSFGRRVFGGLVHAYGVQSLLDNSGLKRDFQVRFISIFIGVMLLFIFQWFGRKRKGPLLILIPIWLIIHFIISYSFFMIFHFWFFQWGFYSGILILSSLNVLYRRILKQKEWNDVKQKIRQLEEFNHILEESGQMRDILTDSLVHDIKNAIASIEGSLSFMTQKYQEDPLSRRIVQAASMACTDILSLSSNLLDIRRMEEGQCEVQNQTCDFQQIKSMISSYWHYSQFMEKNLELEIIPPEDDFSLAIDPYLTEQIFHNLLNNAFKYTTPGGLIKIGFSTDNNEQLISFFNSGKAIPSEQRDKIFDKYTQLGKRSKYSKGMGLYFCRKAMELQNARIWVQSDEKGNYFILAFKKSE